MKKSIILFLGISVIALTTSCNTDDNGTAPEEIYFNIKITSNSGGIVDIESGNYLKGTTIEATASPADGFEFISWSGDVDSTSPILTFIVDKNYEIHANFSEVQSPTTENVTYINEDLIDDSGYVFAIENGQKTCYLLDHSGNKIYTWEFDSPLGQDIEITPKGTLLGLFKIANPSISFGGQSGLIREIDKDGTILWEYQLSTENEITHHDLTQLPNGNILVLVWERITNDQAVAVGLNNTDDIFTEKVIEINPDTDSIVWEWRSWDHIVQDFDENQPNYGNPAIEKNKINIGYANSNVHGFVAGGDVMHANGLDYLPELDVIALSINFYSEVWIIDHSTTTEQAATSMGGQFDSGGDLLYRFGNQKVFGDPNADHILNFNHHPTFITKNGKLSLMIYNNNQLAQQSSVIEFELPELNGSTSLDLAPVVIFEFTDENLFYGRISGANRLPNGNTLICEGDFGYWEVTANGEVAWKYDGNGTPFWRGIFYPKNSSEIINIGL